MSIKPKFVGDLAFSVQAALDSKDETLMRWMKNRLNESIKQLEFEIRQLTPVGKNKKPPIKVEINKLVN